MNRGSKKTQKSGTPKSALRDRRKQRIRKKISGTPERPRLSVYRGLKHVFVQAIDDSIGKTIVAASSFGKKGETSKRATRDICHTIGLEIAKKCLAKKISKVVFDKNGNIYHGRVKAVADGAREGGLNL